MGFVYYIFDEGYSPPVLEPLSANTLEAALGHIAQVLRDRPCAHSVELWSVDGRVAALHRDPNDPTEGDAALEDGAPHET